MSSEKIKNNNLGSQKESSKIQGYDFNNDTLNFPSMTDIENMVNEKISRSLKKATVIIVKNVVDLIESQVDQKVQ